MRNMSKKLLSMALVIAMVLSLVPMSFAVEGEEATSDVTIKYALSEVLCEGATQTSKDYFSYEKTNGFYNIAAMSQTTIGTKYLKISSYPNYNCGLLTVRPNNWLIFEINVPVKGTYELWINNNVKNSFGNIEAYIFPTSVAANATALSNTDYYVGTLVCDSDNGATTGMAGYVFSKDTANPFKDGEENATHYFETAGKYYIGMKVVSDGDTGENNDCSFADFYLIGGDKYALIGDMTISPESVKAGGTAQAIATAYKSDDGTAATLTYACTDAGVTVDPATGAISIASDCEPGKKTITATDGSAVNSISKEFTVTPPPATDVTIVYDIVSKMSGWDNKNVRFDSANYVSTNGFWQYTANSAGLDTIDSTNFNWNEKGLYIAKENWWATKIYVPKDGNYTPSLQYLSEGNYSGEERFYVHLQKVGEGVTPLTVSRNATVRLTKNGEGLIPCSVWTDKTEKVDNYQFDEIPLTEGEYYLLYVRERYGKMVRAGNFTLTAGNGDALMPCFDGNSTLEVGNTATLKGFLSSSATAATVTYNSSNDCVTVGTDGTITAVKPGKATVTMTASDSTVVDAANTCYVDINVKDAKTDFVSIGIDDDGDGVATITNAELGETVTAVATVPEGKVFRGWVRGSADNGHLVWDKVEYEFVATTHTYITAIYTDANPAATDEYYHWNGQFLGNTKPATVSPIVGYTFANSWTEAKKENTITSWIADFTKNNDEYAVTGNGFTMAKADNKYDTEVTCTSDSAVYWYRDGKLVDYGTEYKFFIWDKTEVTTSDKGHNGAKLMLDAKKGDSYMVEYDAGNTTLLEVGILFGANGEVPTVERCQEKMSSQRSLNEKGHGQFSATSDYPVARGYLIYQDGEDFRVIYTD